MELETQNFKEPRLKTLDKDWLVIGSDLTIDGRKYIETNIIENISGDNVSFKVIEIPKGSNLGLVAHDLCHCVNVHNSLVMNFENLLKHFEPSFKAAGPKGEAEFARLKGIVDRAKQVG